MVVRSHAGNNGKIVRCIRHLHGAEQISRTGEIVCDIWEIDTPLRGWNGSVGCRVSDSILRPIRDNPGQDETLTWAPLPKKEIA